MTHTLFSIIAGAAILSGMAAPAIGLAQDASGRLIVADTVTRILPYAFAGRDDIRRVEFTDESKCTEIGEYAFLGCRNLSEIILPASLETLGEGCLQECESLKSLSVPQKVKALPKEMLKWCGALESVELPRTLADIGARAFIYCTSLRSVTANGAAPRDIEGAYIPQGVEHIGSNAFGHCAALERVVIPASVTELESYAFAECTSLREAWLPANDCLLGELMFSGCRSLTDLYESSPAVPRFDCDSYIFEPDETALYARCRLHVPAPSRPAYTCAPGWKLFPIIIPMSAVPCNGIGCHHLLHYTPPKTAIPCV
ncbi:MAG: leucine-rich repeat domain-containing protein [Muribaculaceae bacterium]|nr:leucine-rich repeat domain-containing protein [Muribaculaceae bacterium]